MTHLTFSASQCKTLLSQLQCSNESKNAAEAKYMVLSICHQDGRPALVGSTDQPSFDMELSLPLATAEDTEADNVPVDVETCDDQAWKVETKLLMRALSAFGSQTMTMTLMPDGIIELKNESTTMIVKGLVVKADPEVTVQECAGIKADWLVRAGKIAVKLAEQSANTLEKRCVHLHITDKQVKMEGMSGDATAIISSPLQTSPKGEGQDIDLVLSVETVKHLLGGLLVAPKNTDIVTIDTTNMAEQNVVLFRCGGLTLEADNLAVTFPCTSEVMEKAGFETIGMVNRLQLVASLLSPQRGDNQTAMQMGWTKDQVVFTSELDGGTTCTSQADIHWADAYATETARKGLPSFGGIRGRLLLPLLITADSSESEVSIQKNAAGRLRFVCQGAQVII